MKMLNAGTSSISSLKSSVHPSAPPYSGWPCCRHTQQTKRNTEMQNTQNTINKELHEINIMLGVRPMSLPICVIVRARASPVRCTSACAQEFDCMFLGCHSPSACHHGILKLVSHSSDSDGCET